MAQVFVLNTTLSSLNDFVGSIGSCSVWFCTLPKPTLTLLDPYRAIVLEQFTLCLWAHGVNRWPYLIELFWWQCDRVTEFKQLCTPVQGIRGHWHHDVGHWDGDGLGLGSSVKIKRIYSCPTGGGHPVIALSLAPTHVKGVPARCQRLVFKNEIEGGYWSHHLRKPSIDFCVVKARYVSGDHSPLGSLSKPSQTASQSILLP